MDLAHRALDGVGLRRQRQVDRRLGERELRLGEADVLDRVRRGDGDRQRLRVRVADVLGGEHDHAAGDEARVLAALDHRGEVVQRRVGVRAARRLDPGRDVVVVLVAGLVVEHGLALQRVLRVAERDPRLLPALRRRDRQLERVQGRPRVAARAHGEERDDLGGHLDALAGAPFQRPPQQPLEILRLERLQLVDLRPRQQRGVDLEVGVLRRRPDQRQEPVLDRGQQRVLLRLVEAVDLVEEEDRRAAAAPPLASPARSPRAPPGAPR